MRAVADGTWIIYDGDCPFCQQFARLIRLRETAGPVRLINARDGGPEVDAAHAAGLSLDKGMVLHHQGQLYHGDEAVQKIALMSTRSGLFNSIAVWTFSSPLRARVLYPVLKACRTLALRVLGRGGIEGPS